MALMTPYDIISQAESGLETSYFNMILSDYGFEVFNMGRKITP